MTGQRGGRQGGYYSSVRHDFKGDTPELGAVVGLRSEHLQYKFMYDEFLEKVRLYVTKELTNGENLTNQAE